MDETEIALRMSGNQPGMLRGELTSYLEENKSEAVYLTHQHV